MFQTLSTLWTALRYLPMLVSLIGKIRTAFASDSVQEVIIAIGNLIDRTAQGDGGSGDGRPQTADGSRERRRRIALFRDRMRVARTMSDKEVNDFGSAVPCRTESTSRPFLETP